MRKLAMVLVLVAMLVAVYLTERRQSSTVVGLGAVMRLIADFQNQAERLPLTATRISDREEADVGLRLARQYRLSGQGDHLRDEDRAVEKYLQQVGSGLSANAERSGIRYNFYVHPSKAMNAFALPGGHIVVLRGLFDTLESEDELASVLSHEIAHVDRRHAIERLQYGLAARKLGLSLPYAIASIPITLFQAGYSKERELEADRVGLGYAVAAGYSPQGAIDLFRRWQIKEGGATRRPATPVDEMGRVIVEGPGEYFRSHPPAAVRIAELDKEIRARGWKRSAVRPLGSTTAEENFWRQ